MSFSDKAFHAATTTIKIAASTASTNMALGVSGAGAHQVQVTNGSTSLAFVTFGTSTVEATVPTTAAASSGYLIPPSGQVVVTPGLATYMAAALAAGTGSIYAAAGEGR